jgi:hypothetical protein
LTDRGNVVIDCEGEQAAVLNSACPANEESLICSKKTACELATAAHFAVDDREAEIWYHLASKRQTGIPSTLQIHVTA